MLRPPLFSAASAITNLVSPGVDAPSWCAVEGGEVRPGGRAEVLADAQPATPAVGAVPVDAGNDVTPRIYAGCDAAVLPDAGTVVTDPNRHVRTDGEILPTARQAQRLTARSGSHRRRCRQCNGAAGKCQDCGS